MAGAPERPADLDPLVPFPPMEAELVRELPLGDGWAYEPKWDGFRGVLENAGGELRLWSRNGRPLLRYFPELQPLGELLPPRSALDGEIVIDIDGAIDFDAMQTRLHPAESRIRKLSGEIPARFIAFDILVWDGAPLWEKPFAERRAALERDAAAFSLSPSVADPETRDGVARGARGCSASTASSRSGSSGRSSRARRGAVVKVKPERTADCVVVGVRWKSKPDVIATLLLGLYDDDGETTTSARRPSPRAATPRSPSRCSRSSTRPRTGASRSRTAGAAAGSRSSRFAPSSWPRCATTRCRADVSGTARSCCGSGPTRIRRSARGRSCGRRASRAG